MFCATTRTTRRGDFGKRSAHRKVGQSFDSKVVQAVSDACLRSCCYDTVLARQILQGVISADSLLTIAEFQSLQFLQALEPCARRK